MQLSTSNPTIAMLHINQQVDFQDAILESSDCTYDDRENSTVKQDSTYQIARKQLAVDAETILYANGSTI